jgi:hypothetical protein
MNDEESAAQPSEMLDEMVDAADSQKVSLAELLATIENRSFGPLLLLSSAIALSPIGAIPGMSILTGSLIILTAGQMLVGRQHPWLPQRLLKIKISRERFTKTVDWLRPWAKWIEKISHERLALLTQKPATYVVAVLCILLAVTFYPLALVPYGVAAPAAAVVMLSLGITMRDGVPVILGGLLSLLTIGLCWYLWPW